MESVMYTGSKKVLTYAQSK